MLKKRQCKHYDADIPSELTELDISIAEHTATNLVEMLRIVKNKIKTDTLIIEPVVPGLGWISSGSGDFQIGNTLIEVKCTDRNFVSGDFRQILMYWLLKYAASIENNTSVWNDCYLINPRRGLGLLVNYNFLLKSASENLNKIELYKLLSSLIETNFDSNANGFLGE